MARVFDPEGVIPRAITRFAPVDGARVLDVGCGDGVCLISYTRTSRSVVGIDRDSALLQKAAGHPVSPPNASFLAARAECLPFCAGSFDLAVLAWSF